MKLPGKPALISNALALLFVLFLYVGDVSDYFRALTADVSALQKLPNITFASIVLFATAVATVFAAMAIARSAPSSAKAFRLLPIVAVVAVFIDLFVLSADAPIMSSPEHMKMMLQSFARVAHERSSFTQVTSNERDLSEALKDFGAPPYLVKGKPAEAYALQRRENCDGPIKDAPGAQVGTFLYCVSKDKQLAWVSVIGLPYEQRFGVPSVLSVAGEPLFAMVVPQIPAEPDPANIEGQPELLDGGSVPAPVIDGGR